MFCVIFDAIIQCMYALIYKVIWGYKIDSMSSGHGSLSIRVILGSGVPKGDWVGVAFCWVGVACSAPCMALSESKSFVRLTACGFWA